MAELLRTDRLILREWAEADADAALAVYGDPAVVRWLAPVLDCVPDAAAMRAQLREWIAATREGEEGLGHWAVELVGDGSVVGGVSLHALPVGEQDVEIGWQLAPAHWGHGYAVEAARRAVDRAFSLDIDEVFALVRPRNVRGEATARRLGMQWVGETEKYYGLRLHLYRMRSSDREPDGFALPA